MLHRAIMKGEMYIYSAQKSAIQSKHSIHVSCLYSVNSRVCPCYSLNLSTHFPYIPFQLSLTLLSWPKSQLLPGSLLQTPCLAPAKTGYPILGLPSPCQSPYRSILHMYECLFLVWQATLLQVSWGQGVLCQFISASPAHSQVLGTQRVSNIFIRLSYKTFSSRGSTHRYFEEEFPTGMPLDLKNGEPIRDRPLW